MKGQTYHLHIQYKSPQPIIIQACNVQKCIELAMWLFCLIIYAVSMDLDGSGTRLLVQLYSSVIPMVFIAISATEQFEYGSLLYRELLNCLKLVRTTTYLAQIFHCDVRILVVQAQSRTAADIGNPMIIQNGLLANVLALLLRHQWHAAMLHYALISDTDHKVGLQPSTTTSTHSNVIQQ